jgi:hypothetical protein
MYFVRLATGLWHPRNPIPGIDLAGHARGKIILAV